MSGNRYVPTIFTASDINGAPVPGAKLYFYVNNSTTPKDTYSDIGLSITNSFPVVADNRGMFIQDIFMQTSTYRIVLTDANDVVIWDKNDCNTFNGAPVVLEFPFPGAVIEFFGTQDQLNVALAAFWYVMDGNNGLPNLNDLLIKTGITVGQIGTIGGTATITPAGTVGAHALTIAEMPTHRFKNGVGWYGGAGNNPMVYASTATDTPGVADSYAGGALHDPDMQGYTEYLGSGDTHTHTLTMNSFDNQAPFYTLIKLCYLGY